MGTHPIFESDFDCLTERMFRKFDEKESVSSVSQLKSSVQKNIRNQIIDTYPTFEPYFSEIWPKKEPARLAKTHEKVEVLVVNHEPIFFKCRDSQWLPNIRLLHQYPFLLPIQQVDEERGFPELTIDSFHGAFVYYCSLISVVQSDSMEIHSPGGY